MQGIAVTDFHCQSGNVTCYCADPRFGYGIRDCSNEACGAAVASSAISFGYDYCAS
ncbi:hypothetical protein EV356DRAFT_503818, partial [Viridothelium virens]